MAQRMMQEHLYGDLLAPTQGYHTDFAMGMTYSLGFDALLTAQLAFGMLGDLMRYLLHNWHSGCWATWMKKPYKFHTCCLKPS